MRSTRTWRRWAPVLGGAALVTCMSFTVVLEGATPAARPFVGRASTTKAKADGLPILHAGRLGDVAGIPVAEPVVVNYLDDEATRMRAEGTLVGPWRPAQGGVAGGGCTFDIQCDDCNPCTNDRCLINAGDPIGSGTCSSEVTADGQGAAACSDGVFCNGIETCQSGVCEAPGEGTGVAPSGVDGVNNDGTCQKGACIGGLDHGETCDQDTDCRDGVCGTAVCDETNNTCTAPCTTRICSPASPNANLVCTDDSECGTGGTCLTPDGVCTNHSACDGTETCDLGLEYCLNGTIPCGPGTLADCSDTSCTVINSPSSGPRACTTDADCGTNTCVKEGETGFQGPGCPLGNCCTDAGGGEFTAANKSYTKCQAAGQYWQIFPADHAANQPSPPCPKYSSGITPPVDFGTELALVAGPVSPSVCSSVSEMGDDYTISNGSYIAVEDLTFVGGVETVAEERMSIEFYDAAGNFIEDTFFASGSGLAIRRIAFDPPIVIPPSGYIVWRVAEAFAPNGRIYLASTEGVDIGTNDAGSMWVNGAPSSNYLKECVGGDNDGGWCDPAQGGSDCPSGTCTDRDNVLAFSLAGEKADSPEGACCDLLAGTCADAVLPWVCRDNGGVPRGAGQPCSFCQVTQEPGCTSDADCSVCDADLSTPCTTATDCVAAGGGACNSLGDYCNQPCQSGACCLAAGGCSDGMTKTACEGGGGAFLGFGTDCDPDCCSQAEPSGGDDCSDATVHVMNLPATGLCETGPNIGQSCTGPGDCAGELCSRTVSVTITGDNSNATGPDSCSAVQFDPEASDVQDVDPGWWEAFSIDDCAFVRLDMCCSVPLHAPQWVVMWDGCPCQTGTGYFNAVNPNKPNLAANSRGAPFCDSGDDNLWWQYGPLPAGTYYQPIFSALAGAHGPYQLHIVAQACPTAACCFSRCDDTGGNACSDDSDCNVGNGEVCLNDFCVQPCSVDEECTGAATCQPLCALTNVLECDAVRGNFIAPPFRDTANTLCNNNPATCVGGSNDGGLCTQEADCPGGDCIDPSTCGTGSCCLGPGDCKDSQSGDSFIPINKDDCDGLGGSFVGGMRCLGGSCITSGLSCQVTEDCPEGGIGPCNAREGESIDQPSPCPICDILLPANCQLFGEWDSFAYVSDRCFGDGCLHPNDPTAAPQLVVADDFVADESGDITKVCVLGTYGDQDNNLADCGDDRTLPEDFQITVYADASGIPGAPLVPPQIGTVIASGVEQTTAGGTQLWRYQFGLETPIPVLAGSTYWLAVSANTDGLDENGEPSGRAACDWFWMHSKTDDPAEGNGYAFQNVAGAPWDLQDVTNQGTGALGDDPVWCIDIANSVPPVPQRACCTCAGGAAGTEDPNCTVTDLNTCLNSLDGDWILDQVECAGGFTCPAQGPPNDLCVDAILLDTSEQFEWGNRCSTGSVAPLDEVDCGDTVSSPFDRDLWFNWVAPESADYEFTTCFTDPFGFLDTIMTVYSDGTGTCPCPSNNSLQLACSDDGCGVSGGFSRIVQTVEAGVCYTIRVGGYAGTQGNGVLEVAPAVAQFCQPDPIVAESQGANRYLTFDIPAVSDANCSEQAIRVKMVALDGFSIPTPDVLWVGEPTDAPDENSAHPGQTFRVAPLQCDPLYRDWSDTPTVSVYAGDVVPASTYEVQQVDASCTDLGNEDCYSTAASITTAAFGDVVAPFAGGASAQPDFSDIASIVDKFLASPSAPGKRFAQLFPATVFPSRPIDFNDIATDVDAFLGAAYSSESFGHGPCGCPSLVTCGATSCSTDGQCAGGLCIGGSCRDACGRCTP